MPLNDSAIYSSAIEDAIDPLPLIVSPETPVAEVLALMSQVRSNCRLPAAGSPSGATVLPEIRATCVLVMAGAEAGMYCPLPGSEASGERPVLGIFTERDIVRLTASRKDFKNRKVAEVMTKPVITLTQSGSQGIFTALSLFRQHRIRHLPILDREGKLLGMVTPETIRNALKPANILTRLRFVKDVMRTSVIQAPKDASVFELAELMAYHHVSCVVIAEQRGSEGAQEPSPASVYVPVGIVTERDIVQFQALELDLGKMQAKDVMSSPLFCLTPEESLWFAHEEMQRLHVRRIVVTGTQGELLGIVSQTSLLQALDPKEMYGIIEALQHAVEERTSELKQTNERLQTEILERRRAEVALQEAHDELQILVEERTAELKAANARLQQDIFERQRVEVALRQSESQMRLQAQHLAQTLHELQQTQTQLVQAEKMSSLGQLVAGIAHEINNPVNFIYGNLSYASEYIQDLLRLLNLYRQTYPDPAPEIKEEAQAIELDFLTVDLPKLLDSMKLGAERIRQIVLSLRNFSRLDEADKKRVDIHSGIDSTLLILHHRLKAKSGHPAIDIVQEYGVLPPVDCYAGTLNQVFMNILSNAIDALETTCIRCQASDDQTLSAIRSQVTGNEAAKNHLSDPLAKSKICRLTSHTRPESCYLKPIIRIRTELIDSNWVAVRIADNGPGMPEEVRQRLFEPFFTTKPVGKGTGLGLSISYQIVVDKHRGQLECVSEPGKGTEFIIQIPVRQQKLSTPLMSKVKLIS
ncbi:MAG: CBS domain-containing protein [Oscillatoria sp. Prado101]|jgi:signal transduction histidine kinase|nr:CBS domain-containing protein [Oscillatoria sp. Prado101]